MTEEQRRNLKEIINYNEEINIDNRKIKNRALFMTVATIGATAGVVGLHAADDPASRAIDLATILFCSSVAVQQLISLTEAVSRREIAKEKILELNDTKSKKLVLKREENKN